MSLPLPTLALPFPTLRFLHPAAAIAGRTSRPAASLSLSLPSSRRAGISRPLSLPLLSLSLPRLSLLPIPALSLPVPFSLRLPATPSPFFPWRPALPFRSGPFPLIPSPFFPFPPFSHFPLPSFFPFPPFRFLVPLSPSHALFLLLAPPASPLSPAFPASLPLPSPPIHPAVIFPRALPGPLLTRTYTSIHTPARTRIHAP